MSDFMNQETRADGVEPAGGDEDGGNRMWLDRVHDPPRCRRRWLARNRACHATFQANVKFRAPLTIGDEPHLSFRLAA